MNDIAKRARWAAYVTKVSGGLKGTAISREMRERWGTAPNQSTIDRWINATVMPLAPGDVAAFAQTYDRNVLEAFVAASMLELPTAEAGLDDNARKMLRDIGVRVPRKRPGSEASA